MYWGYFVYLCQSNLAILKISNNKHLLDIIVFFAMWNWSPKREKRENHKNNSIYGSFITSLKLPLLKFFLNVFEGENERLSTSVGSLSSMSLNTTPVHIFQTTTSESPVPQMLMPPQPKICKVTKEFYTESKVHVLRS